MIDFLSSLAMPLALCAVGCILLFCKGNRFDAFLRGARQGLETALRLLPTLVALVTAVSMLNASGAVEAVASLLSPAAEWLGLPRELLPLLLTRPFSGSASTATYTALLEAVGPTSLAGLCATVIFASSDTAVYIVTLYFSSINVRRTRYALPLSLAVMLFCIFFSCFLCRVWFF